MKERRDIPAIIAVCVTLLLLLLTALPKVFPELFSKQFSSEKIRALICQDSQQNGNSSLIIGYSYFLLEEFIRDEGFHHNIAKARNSDDPAQALLSGDVDILAIPAQDSLESEGIALTQPLDSFCRWAFRAKDKALLKHAEKWISLYNNDNERFQIRDAFLNPSGLGPYIAYIKESASSNGWDWRLISAVIHQESKYHIEAVSRTGAKGLGQFMDATAGSLGISNHLDPKENIEACARYLGKLHRHFKSFSAKDRINLTLASYNGGLSNILEGINYADSLDLGHDWDAVKEAFTQMADSTSAKQKIYREAIDFVEKVQGHYDSLCRKYPD